MVTILSRPKCVKLMSINVLNPRYIFPVGHSMKTFQRPMFLHISTRAWGQPFLRRAMKSGTRITGQLRQPTTSFHTWPITWDIKGVCVCSNIIAPSVPLTDKTMCIVLQF